MHDDLPLNAGSTTARGQPLAGARAFDPMALSRSVAADMEALFGTTHRNLARSPAPRRDRGGSRAAPAASSNRFGQRAGSLVALAIVGVLGLAAGALLRSPAPGTGASPTPPATPAVATVAAVAQPPATPAAAPPALTVPQSAESAVPPPASVVYLDPPEKLEKAERARAAPTVAPVRRTVSRTPPCGSNCSRAEVLAADRSLRRAYANAIRAGLSRRDLERYRDDWLDLRDGAWDNPRRLVAGYTALAGELNRAARSLDGGD